PPNESILRIGESAHFGEAAFGEHASRGVWLRKGVGAHESDIAVGDGEMEERLCRFRRQALAAIIGRNAIGNFDEASLIIAALRRRPFESSEADDELVNTMHDGKPKLPRVGVGRRGKLSKVISGDVARDIKVSHTRGGRTAEGFRELLVTVDER